MHVRLRWPGSDAVHCPGGTIRLSSCTSAGTGPGWVEQACDVIYRTEQHSAFNYGSSYTLARGQSQSSHYFARRRPSQNCLALLYDLMRIVTSYKVNDGFAETHLAVQYWVTLTFAKT